MDDHAVHPWIFCPFADATSSRSLRGGKQFWTIRPTIQDSGARLDFEITTKFEITSTGGLSVPVRLFTNRCPGNKTLRTAPKWRAVQPKPCLALKRLERQR